MGRRPLLSFWTAFLAVSILFLPFRLDAEYRTYYSDVTRGKMISDLLDRMGEAGFRFSILRVYDEKRDGKLGFNLRLQPGKRYCDLIFFEGVGGKGSIVRVFTQDARDMSRFHKLLAETMKMREEGAKRSPSPPRKAWPRPQ